MGGTEISIAPAVAALTFLAGAVVTISALKIGPAGLMTAARWAIAAILK